MRLDDGPEVRSPDGKPYLAAVRREIRQFLPRQESAGPSWGWGCALNDIGYRTRIPNRCAIRSWCTVQTLSYPYSDHAALGHYRGSSSSSEIVSVELPVASAPRARKFQNCKGQSAGWSLPTPGYGAVSQMFEQRRAQWRLPHRDMTSSSSTWVCSCDSSTKRGQSPGEDKVTRRARTALRNGPTGTSRLSGTFH